MHPFGFYLAVVDGQRDGGATNRTAPRERWAPVDAEPILESDRESRVGRLAALVRRRVLRAAGA